MAETTRMRIGELAKRAGVTTRTIRYYEELGLLGKEQEQGERPRAEGDFRYYGEMDLARLQKITLLKQIGLSLEQIGNILDLFFIDQQTTLQAKQQILAILHAQLREAQEKTTVLQQFCAELQQKIALIQQSIEQMHTE